MSLTVNTHLLHIIPVGDDAVLDGVLEGQDTPLALGLITYVAVLLTHTHHHTLREEAREEHKTREDAALTFFIITQAKICWVVKKKGGPIEAHLVAGPSNNGREDSTGSVISGESSLDQARAVVAHKGGSLVVVTHD